MMSMRDRVAASLQGEGERHDVYAMRRAAQDMPVFVELDGTEAEFLADQLQWLADRRAGLTAEERALVHELRERIRPACRDRRTMELPRPADRMGDGDGLGA
jgi:hypothetical protein